MRQNAHSKAQLCEPIRPWSLKNKTPFWSRKEDDSFRATEQPSTLMYPRDRTPHSDRHGRLDPGMASIKEQQQSDPDFDLAAEVINESNESSSELLILDRVKERLHHGDDAIKDMYAKIRTAGKTLDLVATGTAPKSRDPDVLAAAMRIIFKHLAGYLSRIEQAQQESRQRLTPLEAAIKSLVCCLIMLCHKEYTDCLSRSEPKLNLQNPREKGKPPTNRCSIQSCS